MSAGLEFRSAASYSVEAMADLYTRTFAGYFYDAFITPALMASFCRVEQIDMHYSPVMCVGGEPVGLATLGLRGTRAYCKGFGVVLSHRGRGLAHALCGELIRQARSAGACELTLGVMQRNTRAVQAYEGAGLRIVRELLSFEWSAGDAPPPNPPPVHAREPRALLASFDALHATRPAWRRDLPSLLAMTDLRGFALAGAREPAAYVLAEFQPDGEAHIADLAARDAADATALLRAVQARAPRVACSSEPAGSPLVAAFWNAGFQLGILRYEMAMTL